MKRSYILLPVLGAVLGHLLLHPYTMLIYALMHFRSNAGSRFYWKDLASQALAAFDPVMLPMGVAFALFGALIGLLTSLLLERNRRLHAAEQENREKKIALDTLKEVVVTLSHYLLNANMIIGGKVRHCRKATADHNLLASLAVIEEQGRKIDAVIDALRHSTDIKVSGYTSDGTVKMIDLEEEIKKRMKNGKASSEKG
ncbi:hypothetical protein [Desulforhabdus sp. TSK]|uniref:hypothetical protein n=1 Tax=Desulforhabdus sp. TSK TaxID=2925014 RepID=UPI001FC8692F|nr:hypothetical protein [Desulforhabdus sp. TSK]GKT10741.1 hypothetical protein DSTSK_40460 [Desulforhabdus sp. TSK]